MKKLYLEIKYNKDGVVKGYLLDLSYGGMSIACSKLINKNTMIAHFFINSFIVFNTSTSGVATMIDQNLSAILTG